MTHSVWELFNSKTQAQEVIDIMKNGCEVGFVELWTSHSCKLHCRHCFHGNVRTLDHPLSIDEWERVIDQFLALGVRHFHVAGKEPLDDATTFAVLSYLNSKRGGPIRFGVITNGTQDKKYLNEIARENIDYLEVSIDGLPATHDFIRGKGVYRRAIAFLQEALLVLGSDRVSTATVLHKGNVPEIPGLVRTMCDLGVRRIFLQPLLPIGSAVDLNTLILKAHELRHTLIELKTLLNSSMYQKYRVVVMFHIPVTLIRQICEGKSELEELLETFLFKGSAVTKAGINHFQIDFQAIKAPFLSSFIVTNDGYLLDECLSASTNRYDLNSAGNVRDVPIAVLVKVARQIGVTRIEERLKSGYSIYL